MTGEVAGPAFLLCAAASLSTSSVLVSRIERVAERLGLSEALLGVVAALAADGPEITSAVSAIATHQARVGAGVVLGSGAFNLAALLGLGAVAAGWIALHRRVIVMGGAIAGGVVSGALAVLLGAAAGWVLLVVATWLSLYVGVLGTAHRGLRGLPAGPRARAWLVRAVTEEEEELEEALRPEPGGPRDAVVAAASLLVVIAASVVMERSASALGSQLGVPDIVVGTLVLGGVTGIPNAVASTYLARRGRGAAALSTALNSNNLNILLGLLVPAAVVGLGAPSGQSALVATWCLAMTVVTLAAAYRARGLRRATGVVILGLYAAFAGTVVAAGLG